MKSKCFLPFLMASSQLYAASSHIPEKREYPVNPKINACTDFYEYACSKVIEDFKLPDDRSRHLFSFSDSRERILEKKKKFLSELDQKKDLSDRTKTLKTVYGACMNEQGRKSEEQALVQQLLADLKKIKDHATFQQFLAKQRHSGHFSFIDVGSIANQDNPDLYDFYFMADMMTLPERSYYQNKATLEDYQNLVTQFFKTIDDKNAKERAKKLIAFEKSFAENYPLPAELREIFVKKSDIDRPQVIKNYPRFKLVDDLQKVPDNVNIRHITPDNYRFVHEQLEKAPLDTLKDVYLFHALSAVMDDAYPKYYKTKFDFNHKHLGGPKVRPDRQEYCTEWVMGQFTKELDAELLPEMFPDFPEEKFIELAEKVRGSIIQGVKDNEWLSKEGKEGAIKKLQSARLQLVKPRNDEEWYFNPVVTYTSDQPIENSRRLNLALTERMYRELGTKRNKDRWWMGPLTVNAYYSPSDNKFVMPIGILQYPFYDPKLPETINLGAVGAVIGHELGHGIDDKGAMFDYQGRLKQWMSDSDLQSFKNAGAKFISQFDKIGHNGKLTLGENIGDWTGLTFAYRAAFPDDKGDRETKQKFFLQYARLWCEVVRPKMKERMLKTNPHPIGKARVNEQVIHQGGFAEAFQCKKGDPMYLPEAERIKVW